MLTLLPGRARDLRAHWTPMLALATKSSRTSEWALSLLAESSPRADSCPIAKRPLTVVQIVVTVARKRTGERRLNAASNSRPIRPWPGVSSGEMPNTFCAGAPGRWLRYTLMTAAVTYMNATPVRKPDRTGGDSQDCLCRPLPRRKKAVTSTITWRIAPAPTPRARADHWVP